jgi:hypothetical protein
VLVLRSPYVFEYAPGPGVTSEALLKEVRLTFPNFVDSKRVVLINLSFGSYRSGAGISKARFTSDKLVLKLLTFIPKYILFSQRLCELRLLRFD